jgi:uncharacterized protein (TIGR00251 family)
MKITARVIPRAAKNKIEKISGNVYKIWVTSAPVDGKANDMVIKLLASRFKVSKSSLKIIRGKTARNKILEIL